MGLKQNKACLPRTSSSELKSDHFGIETPTAGKQRGLCEKLKSDHFGIETPECGLWRPGMR